MDDRQVSILEDLLDELRRVLAEIKKAAPVPEDGMLEADQQQPDDTPEESWDTAAFFSSIRSSLFGGKLTQSQVSGIEANLHAFREAGFPLAWTAYALATSFHETAQRMQPVREGLNASDAWRRRNLRYYPYYGRGFVQLTWLENYQKADEALGLGGSLLKNLDLALDPQIASKIMVRGMTEGWFAGDSKGRHTLHRHLPTEKATREQFRSARRIINGTDRADLIAGYAIKFQDALIKGQ